MANLQEYLHDARFRAERLINQRIFVDSKEHSQILAEVMLGEMPSDSDVVGVYSKQLPEWFFGEPLRNCRAKQIDIVVDDDSVVDWVCRIPGKKIFIYKLNKPRPNRFFFNSKGAFRYGGADGLTAEANFSEASVVEKLTATLSGYISESSPLNQDCDFEAAE